MSTQRIVKNSIGAIMAAGVLITVSGCTTMPMGSDETAKPMAKMDGMTSAEMEAKHAECKAMHDKMMADMKAGMPMDHSKTSPEMQVKHDACMKMMSEMKPGN